MEYLLLVLFSVVQYSMKITFNILKCKRFEQIRLKLYDKVSKTLNVKIFNNVENKMKMLVLNNKSVSIKEFEFELKRAKSSNLWLKNIPK